MRNLITKTSFGNGTTEVLVRIKVDSGQLQSGNHLKIELDVSYLEYLGKDTSAIKKDSLQSLLSPPC